MRNRSILPICWLFLHIFANESLGDTADLAVHVETHKSTLVLGEPLFITVRVRNESTEPAKVAAQSSPGYERRSRNPFLVMISTDGNRYHAWFDGFRPTEKTSPIELAPGAELSSELVILFTNGDGFAFEQPGEYWVLVKVNVSHPDMVSFQSEPIKVTVTRPGRESLEAWSVLGSEKFSKKYGELIQMPWYAKLSADDLEECDGIIRLYPNSIYPEYLALYLGRWYLEGAQTDKIQGRGYLQIAKSMVSSDYLRAKVMKLLATEETGDQRIPP